MDIGNRLRADYNNDLVFFPLPRVSLLYKNDNGFSSRIGGGLGYKIPDILQRKQSISILKNVLAIDKSTVDAERSYGVNFDVNYKTRLSDEIGFSVNQLFYATAINDGLLLNSTDMGYFSLKMHQMKFLVKEQKPILNLLTKDFRWFLNYAFIDTKLNYLPGNPQSH